MKFTTAIAMLSAFAMADECADDPSGPCDTAWTSPCADTPGLAKLCPATCFKNYQGPKDGMPTSCEEWKAYSPGGAAGGDSDCQDDSNTDCSQFWVDDCENKDGVARKCPARCLSQVHKEDCSYWKTYYPFGGSEDCHDDPDAGCSGAASAWSCMNTVGVAASCPQWCAKTAPPSTTKTCAEWKSLVVTTPAPQPTQGPVTPAITTTTQAGPAPDVPKFTMTFNSPITITDYTTAKTAYVAPQSAGEQMRKMAPQSAGDQMRKMAPQSASNGEQMRKMAPQSASNGEQMRKMAPQSNSSGLLRGVRK